MVRSAEKNKKNLEDFDDVALRRSQVDVVSGDKTPAQFGRSRGDRTHWLKSLDSAAAVIQETQIEHPIVPATPKY